jgi:2,4-dienoyl-CoA reductase (NADPH2)
MVTNMDPATFRARCWYAERARGGVGLVIVEATRLHRFDEEGFGAALAKLTAAVHAQGTAIAIQLFAEPVGAALSGRPAEAVSVSGGEGYRAITPEEIRTKVAAFARAAKICQEAGFDAVEPHGAHGFFLNQFFSPAHNQRQDEYGGHLEGRMRFGLEVVQAVREAVGPDFLILYRHTAQTNDYPLSDSQAFAPRLVEAGVNVLDISPSTASAHADLAAGIKSVVDVPVIAVGGMNDPDAAEAALAAQKCDLVAIGRGLIADAFWVEKVQQGRASEIIECVQCNEGCFGNLRSGKPIGCTQNPESGEEYLRPEYAVGKG